jgi:hypothetical protein
MDAAGRPHAGPRRAPRRTGVLAVLLLGSACTANAVTPSDPEAPADTAVVYVPGQSYFGQSDYVEYIAGDMPIILSAAHGGDMTPGGIPDRTESRCGVSPVVVQDRNTRQLVLQMRDELHERFGGHAHVVINHLHRRKLDANRNLAEAACGDSRAGQAWHEFQQFLEEVGDSVLMRHGRGWYMDIHGHGHAIQRVELGYLVPGGELDRSDEALAVAADWQDRSSIRTTSEASPLNFPELLRGSTSLGALYEENGFPTVPSPGSPSLMGEPYFSGGYNTRRHACGAEASQFGGEPGGMICGVQIEGNYEGLRDTETNRERFAKATAAVLETFLGLHWELDLETVSP